jgi:hypothetical protein
MPQLGRPRLYGKYGLKGTAATLDTCQSLSTCRFLSENLKERVNFGDIGIDMWVILKLISPEARCGLDSSGHYSSAPGKCESRRYHFSFVYMY